MSQAWVRPLLLAGCLHGVFAECNVYLETETMKGPGVCTEAGVEAMTAPEEKQLAQCLHECWASYVITSQPAKGANAALAKPERDSCSTNFEIVCSTVELSCAKPFSEFPNACSGTVPLAQMPAYYLAFYAYSQDVGGGNSDKMMAARVVRDKDTICSSIYGVRKASNDNCFGLTTTINTESHDAGPGVDPPQPPAIDNMPAQFPAVEPNKEQPETSSTSSTSTTAAPEPDGKAVKHGLGEILPWLAAGCAVLLLIGAGLYIRRSRQAEEQRALRTSTEVEIQSVNSLNRF
ncbi:unnamed protein product [Symbiodinium sp. CCMP2456]|nr:unnamed protein product [Symbiodinium sp. CCMP2456]